MQKARPDTGRFILSLSQRDVGGGDLARIVSQVTFRQANAETTGQFN
jgi:hypothetical protein